MPPARSTHSGNCLSIRAVARDGNTVGGPGIGTSETRTFRLAKAEEYQGVGVEGAPGFVDGRRLDDLVAAQLEEIVQQQAIEGVVLHDQDTRPD